MPVSSPPTFKGGYATASQNITGISEEVCRTDGSANTATVAAAGTDKIDGVASLALARYECLKLQSDSSANWYEISKITGP